MRKYTHKVHYYETDKMGIVHHSNYIKWLEEARVEMMREMGYSFKSLEEQGIFSPVLSYTINIKHSSTFDDNVDIYMYVKSYNSVRLEIEYDLKIDDKIIATAVTKHCFTNAEGLPLRLNRINPGLDQLLKEKIGKEEI